MKPELSLEDEINNGGPTREEVERERLAFAKTEELPAHQAIRQKEMAKRESGARLAAVGAWAVTAVAFFGLGGIAVTERDTIVEYLPRAASAYAMAGLDVNRFGVELASVEANRTFSGTTPVLNVSGAVLNVTDTFRVAPAVRIDLRNDAGDVVKNFLVSLETQTLAPGDTALFETRLESPPLEAFDVSMSFADPVSAPTPSVTQEVAQDASPEVEYGSVEPELVESQT